MREAILLGNYTFLLVDEKFMILYDANKPTNPKFKYNDYKQFDLENYNNDECNAYFR